MHILRVLNLGQTDKTIQLISIISENLCFPLVTIKAGIFKKRNALQSQGGNEDET